MFVLRDVSIYWVPMTLLCYIRQARKCVRTGSGFTWP